MFAKQVELSPDVRLVAQFAAALDALLKTLMFFRVTVTGFAAEVPTNFMPVPLAPVMVPPVHVVVTVSHEPPVPFTLNVQFAFTTTGVAPPAVPMDVKL